MNAPDTSDSLRDSPDTRVVCLIRTRTSRGSGWPDNPCRGLTQYFSADGIMVAEVDPIEVELLNDRIRQLQATIEQLRLPVAEK